MVLILNFCQFFDDEGPHWELEVARRKKRWKSKEEELRTGGKDDGSLGAVYHDLNNMKNRQPRQVSSAAASGILFGPLEN
jgi:hypothetical protein